MANEQKIENKPKRLYFKSYIKLIQNSVGSNLFRNFYVETPERGEFDSLDDGNNACAFYVSSVLVIFNKLSGIHGTTSNTIKDLEASGWKEVREPKPGDVLVWEVKEFEDGLKDHIGFYIGDGRAISVSETVGAPIEHDKTFNGKRKIVNIYNMPAW
jgi:hypothetical protein